MNKNALFEEASKQLDAGNKRKAFCLFRKAAELGECSSMNNLGVCYEAGVGTAKNLKLALYWYKKAIRNGNLSSCINIATLYKSLNNLNRAKFWLIKAVHSGDGESALELAKIYLTNQRIDQLDKARYYIEFAIAPSMIRSHLISDDSLLEGKQLLKEIKKRMRK